MEKRLFMWYTGHKCRVRSTNTEGFRPLFRKICRIRLFFAWASPLRFFIIRQWDPAYHVTGGLSCHHHAARHRSSMRKGDTVMSTAKTSSRGRQALIAASLAGLALLFVLGSVFSSGPGD